MSAQEKNSEIKVNNFEIHEFSGPHPAGLAGTHIYIFFDPPNPEKFVWSIGYQDVIAIGKLFLTGFLDVERIIAISGPLAKNPRLVKTILGASLDDILEGEFINLRIVE